MRKIVIMLVLFSLLLNVKGEKVQYSGFVQNWFSWMDNDDLNHSTGFTLRRVRLKLKGDLEKDLTWCIQAGYDRLKPSVLDVYLNYRTSNQLDIRTGHYVVPGPKGSSLTSSSKLDYIERPLIIQLWNDFMNLKSNRSLGVQISSLFQNKLYWAFMFFNPQGGENGLFNPDYKESSFDSNKSLAYMGRIEFSPDKKNQAGLFFGYNPQSNTNLSGSGELIENTISYGFHLYLYFHQFSLKTEFIGNQVSYKNNIEDFSLLGYYGQIGWRLNKKTEFFFRYDYADTEDIKPDHVSYQYFKDKETRFSPGVSFYASETIKLQGNYVYKTGDIYDEYEDHLLYFCLQYLLK